MTINSELHSRFLFENDFSNHSMRNDPISNLGSGTFSGPQDAAYEQGFSDGRLEEQNKIRVLTSGYIDLILNRIDELEQRMTARTASLEAKIISSVVDLGIHFINNLDPIDILENPKFGFLSVIEMLDRDAQLTLHVSQHDFAAIENELTNSEKKSPFALRIDPSMQDGDFELIWADGGMKLEREALRERFRTIESAYLSMNS